MQRYRIWFALTLGLAVLLLACEATGEVGEEPMPTDVESPSATPFTELPPCTPIAGATYDPCAQDGETLAIESTAHAYFPDGPRSLTHFIEADGKPAWTAHFVVRGTYIPDTVRCATFPNFFRAPHYYDEATRRELEASIRYHYVKCFADVRVNAYVVGAGPATLTVHVFEGRYGNYEAAKAEGAQLRANLEKLLQEGGTLTGLPYSPIYRLTVPAGGIAGREVVLFLNPDVDLTVETWQVLDTWEVERQDDDTVNATHRSREILLASFVQQVQTIHTARVAKYGGRAGPETTHPMLVTNASGLSQYFRDVGAYSHSDGPPAMPPPAPLVCERAVPDAANNAALVADCEALVALWDAMTERGTLNWSTSLAIGQWNGVTVGGTPKRVQGLRLRDAGLAGTLPNALGDLSHLINLDLSDNAFTGPVPMTLGNLSRLQTLAFEYNQLTGNIPEEVTKLKQLTNLALNANRLDGGISTKMGTLTKLTSLDLAENRLTGRIPTELGNLSALRYLSLGGNDLSGGIPTQLGGIGTLRVLYLDNNDLTGGIPAELGRVTGLEVLVLNGNKLTGSIPAVLGNMTNLEELGLRNNSLTGEIPSTLGSLRNLEYLYLAGNTFTGCIPAGLRSVANNDLSTLRLSYCAV